MPTQVSPIATCADFGADQTGKRLVLDNTTLGLRLFSFHLGYGRAIPWRGVTRASILRKVRPNFPENPYPGFPGLLLPAADNDSRMGIRPRIRP